jgi:hypothetical protein
VIVVVAVVVVAEVKHGCGNVNMCRVVEVVVSASGCGGKKVHLTHLALSRAVQCSAVQACAHQINQRIDVSLACTLGLVLTTTHLRVCVCVCGGGGGGSMYTV